MHEASGCSDYDKYGKPRTSTLFNDPEKTTDTQLINLSMDGHDNLHDPNRPVRGRPTSRGSLKPETSMAIPMIMGIVPTKLGDPRSSRTAS